MAQPLFLDQLADLELRTVRLALFPDRWRMFCAQYRLSWQHTLFERNEVSKISNTPGVYCFHVGHELACLPPLGLSLYGGISEDSLRRRCMKYFWEKDAKVGRPLGSQILTCIRTGVNSRLVGN